MQSALRIFGKWMNRDVSGGARPRPLFEMLEGRRLLSAALLGAPDVALIPSAPLNHAATVVAPKNSSGGLTIHPTPGVKFTATLGSFITIAPATGLKVTVSWGDGSSSSAGTLKSAGIIGVDQIKFNVSGTHTYSKPGVYPIVITVTKPGPSASVVGSIVATIDSTAIVSPKIYSLNGTITGTYALAPTLPDIGATYVFTGSGTAGVLGAVKAAGTVSVPGFIATGQAHGTLTLTSVSATPGAGGGSVTLKLTGPTEAGFGPFPATLGYVITGGTGAFANATGSGTIAVTLDKTKQDFTFVIHTILPPAV